MADPTTTTAVVGAVASVAAAAMGYLSSRFTSRQSRAAATEQQRLEGLKDFRATMTEIADALRKEIADERSRREADRTEYEAKLDAVQVRVKTLERERDQHRGAINALTRYARELVKLLRVHGISPPEPPPEFAERTWP